MPNVVLHIGLHKTATRFLQRAVFASLDTERFLVNPEPLVTHLRQSLRHPNAQDRTVVERAKQEAIEQAGDRTLVISDPTIAGDMYSSYGDWENNLRLINALFPDATIVYFVRRQSDWLHSAYRQSLAKGRGIPIESFLNFRDGAFHERPGRFVGGARVVNALDLCFLEIYKGYANAFGPERVYLFRQEDLRRRPGDVYRRLAEALGTEEIRLPSKSVSGNRAFSALAIHLFFPGVLMNPQGAGRRQYRFAWAERFARTLRRLRTAFIQHVFDKILYRDWDLLARHGMRNKLEAHYEQENSTLFQIAERILNNGPDSRVLVLAYGERVEKSTVPGNTRDA